ncbi:hypothetical protein F2Q69_00030196 [Brassica cretica]|uniref:Uncharacterized protein n=1 Tax=Brassica cretica TaxID=69181 RepID=A0A8S9S5Q5_BRACR|nr:hypothetical protein F2Q69_00030196 [Brassica cretica]
MSKCKDCEEITSLLIGMRNYYLLTDFWTRNSPKYTNIVRTRHTAHWDLTRNPCSQRAGGLTVGVENGYDEVNVQIPEVQNVETFFEIDSSLRKALRRKRESLDKSLKMVATQRQNACSVRSLRNERATSRGRLLRNDRATARGRSLRSDQAFAQAILELFRNVDTTLVHAFSSILRCYLPKTVANPFHVPRHSKLSSKHYRKNRGKFILYRKKP